MKENQQIQDLKNQVHKLLLEKMALQARVDELMLEYCPDEMSEEQKITWGEHQKPLIAYMPNSGSGRVGDPQ